MTREIHWRLVTRNNVTTIYGKDNNLRIFDSGDPAPADPTRVFSWLICESYDDKGNAIVYGYAAENDDCSPSRTEWPLLAHQTRQCAVD